ncbi:hypothetical protein AB0I81_36135 [Nonomuraea sp. NPDC050404]|uniref:hypothetical protein n=1 Tax=Nonomuraea sp. NPDC050404 TaxID=3155783 RepID=UPI0033D0E576
MSTSASNAADARRLVRTIAEGEESYAENPFLGRIRSGQATQEDTRRLVEAELRLIDTEAAAYGAMAMRFYAKPQDVYCTRLLEMVQNAKPRLLEAAGSLGVDVRDASPHKRSELTEHAYGCFLSWLALNGDRAAIGLASYVDVESYYRTQNALAAYLREPGRDTTPEILEYYRHVDAGVLREGALAFAQAGLDEGGDPDRAVRLAGLMREALREFWTAGRPQPHEPGPPADHPSEPLP